MRPNTGNLKVISIEQEKEAITLDDLAKVLGVDLKSPLESQEESQKDDVSGKVIELSKNYAPICKEGFGKYVSENYGISKAKAIESYQNFVDAASKVLGISNMLFFGMDKDEMFDHEKKVVANRWYELGALYLKHEGIEEFDFIKSLNHIIFEKHAYRRPDAKRIFVAEPDGPPKETYLKRSAPKDEPILDRNVIF